LEGINMKNGLLLVGLAAVGLCGGYATAVKEVDVKPSSLGSYDGSQIMTSALQQP
jgi:hypothetical protein